MKEEERIEELVDILNKASDAYYNEEEIMSNFDYDKLYDELLSLEKKTGTVKENSPTRHVGYEVKSSLEKEKHEYPALSLDKTKDKDVLKSWLGDKEGVLSWKLDGLTVQLTYDDGLLTKALTRGNGETGENVTHNAVYFKGVPKKIPYKGHLVVRGEALISYAAFDRINASLPDDKKYKNPRNLASGSVRQLDSKEAASRDIEVKLFELVFSEEDLPTYEKAFAWLEKQGFTVVEHYKVTKDTLFFYMSQMSHRISINPFPSDGLVLAYNDIAYGKSLGMTGKFPRHSLAFKWQDETEETVIKKIEWNASRTGRLNPVAVFEPVELEGTTVTRASVHNVSILESLSLSEGDSVTVYKANMIIPQIAENLTRKGTPEIPSECPVCGGRTEVRETLNNGQSVKMLYCTNPSCPAKQTEKFSHFVKRDNMDIRGLSDSTLEKLIDKGWIKSFCDIYHLSEHKDDFTEIEGLGEKSYENLISSIEKSRDVSLESLIASLGIPNVGKDAGKKISEAVGGSLSAFNEKLDSGDFTDVRDIGEVINTSINEWYEQEDNKKEYLDLLKEIRIKEKEKKENSLSGKTFVITGTLTHYKNRDELIKVIEDAGGKVTGSVSKKTDYLINNDTLSTSSKNKKAKELEVPVISEEDFMKLL